MIKSVSFVRVVSYRDDILDEEKTQFKHCKHLKKKMLVFTATLYVWCCIDAQLSIKSPGFIDLIRR